MSAATLLFFYNRWAPRRFEAELISKQGKNLLDFFSFLRVRSHDGAHIWLAVTQSVFVTIHALLNNLKHIELKKLLSMTHELNLKN